jgi:HSP20 family protein
VGHFYRSFALPRRVDAEKISAAYDNGVLRIRVPKTEDSKPRQIKVN